MLSLNKSYKDRKVSLTIHSKYEYFDSAVQRAEDRLFAVNVKLNLSIVLHSHLLFFNLLQLWTKFLETLM